MLRHLITKKQQQQSHKASSKLFLQLLLLHQQCRSFSAVPLPLQSSHVDFFDNVHIHASSTQTTTSATTATTATTATATTATTTAAANSDSTIKPSTLSALQQQNHSSQHHQQQYKSRPHYANNNNNSRQPSSSYNNNNNNSYASSSHSNNRHHSSSSMNRASSSSSSHSRPHQQPHSRPSHYTRNPNNHYNSNNKYRNQQQQQNDPQNLNQKYSRSRDVHASRELEIKAAFATKSLYSLSEISRVSLSEMIDRHEPQLNHFDFEHFRWLDQSLVRLHDDHLLSLLKKDKETKEDMMENKGDNSGEDEEQQSALLSSTSSSSLASSSSGDHVNVNQSSGSSVSSSSSSSLGSALFKDDLFDAVLNSDKGTQAQQHATQDKASQQQDINFGGYSADQVQMIKDNRIMELDVRRVKRLLTRISEGYHSIEFKRNCPVMNFEAMWFSFTNFIVSGAQYADLTRFAADTPTVDKTNIDPNKITLIPQRLAVHLFRVLLDYIVANTDAFTKTSLSEEEQREVEEFIRPFFGSYTRKIHPDDHELYLEGLKYCNFTDPQLHFLRTKRLKRRIIYHAGPTNSGKTYHALMELSKADSGVYMAPLRLLAQEVCNRMNTQYDTKCSLLTGQEKRDVIGANHFACTIEMLNLQQVYNVAIIDEIQMIQDPERGQAWTQALLGVQAQEIHLCGDHTAFELVNRILKSNGDETVELRTYERMTQLQLWPEGSLQGDVSKIEKRDCVIVFSRKHVFEVKQFIEVNTGLKCAVVYGGLPPESRKEQAELFNDETSGYDVLIATDAVGMGLNLNIKRIVFFTTSKPTLHKGRIKRMPVNPMLMKQIAGRAGRKGFYDVGYVTTFEQKDFEYLKQSVALEMKSIESAGIFPSLPQLQGFAKKFPEHSADMAAILYRYILLSKGHKDFFMCDSESKIGIATRIRHLKLTIPQQYTFMNAPIPNIDEAIEILVQYCEDFANPSIHVVPLHLNVRAVITGLKAVQEREEGKLNNKIISHVIHGHSNEVGRQRSDALRRVEFTMKVLDAYKWLAQRFPAKFDNELVEAAQDTIIEEIGKSLVLHTRHNTKNRTLSTLETTKAVLREEPSVATAGEMSYDNRDVFSQFFSELVKDKV